MRTSHHLAIAIVSLVASANAASLKQAEFTRVINDVRVLPAQQQPAPAKIGDKISGRTAVSTGVASRAELRFSDKTLTRIGSNSVFKLDSADRTVNLEKGVILLQVPKQIGGAKVRTAAVTAAVTGTSCIVERTAEGYIKIIVLEGVVDVYFNDDPSNLITLVAGDILIFKDDAKKFPLAAKVDLELLRKTSKLLDPDEFDPLINQKQLADALDEQGRLKNNGELLKTAFEIVGRGTKITLTNEIRMEIFKNLVLQNRDAGNGNAASGSNGGPGGGNNNQSAAQDPGPSPSSSSSTVSQVIRNPGTTVFGTESSIVTNPHAVAFNSIPNAIVTMQGSIYQPGVDGHFNQYMYGDAQTFPDVDGFLSSHGSWFTFKTDTLYISGDVAVNSEPGPRNLILGAAGDVTISHYTPFPDVATDTSWTLPLSVDALLISSQQGSITMDSSFALYGSETPQDVVFYAYGPTSDVSIYGSSLGLDDTESGPIYTTSGIYLPYGTFEAHAGRDIVTNAATVQAGEVKLNARRDVRIENGSTISAKTLLQIEALGHIQIQDSSQLVALSRVDPLSIMLKSVNGNIEIINSYLDATNVEMVSDLGGVAMMNSSIIADVIKARVMSTGGELLVSNSILGRDTTSLIKLYGEGANGVRFSGENFLNAASVHIAGRTVTIDNGGFVRLLEPSGARVFTDNDNYNKSGFGDFTTKTGTPVSVTKDIYNNRPGY